MSVFMTIFGPNKIPKGWLEVCCLESSRGILLKLLGLELNAIWTSSQMAPLMAKTMAAWNVNLLSGFGEKAGFLGNQVGK